MKKSSNGYFTMYTPEIFRMTHGAPSVRPSLQRFKEIYKTDDINLALRRAASMGNDEHIQVMLEDHGADVNSKSPSNNFTALDWAYFKGYMNVVDVLCCWTKTDQSALKSILEKYVKNDEKKWPVKEIAVFRALEANNLKDFEILVDKYKVDLTAKNLAGQTILEVYDSLMKAKLDVWTAEERELSNSVNDVMQALKRLDESSESSKMRKRK